MPVVTDIGHRAAQVARLLLVLADPQQAAARQVRRRDRRAAQRGRRDPRRRGLREAAHPASRCAAGATGNYGQAVPLEGRRAARHEQPRPRACGGSRAWRALQAGARMHEIDAMTRPGGWELRMHPSTKRMATIGGFVAGGSGGVGSITYGGLREPGNILAARVVTHGGDAARASSCAATRRRRSTAPTAPPASSPSSRCRWRRPGRGSS